MKSQPNFGGNKILLPPSLWGAWGGEGVSPANAAYAEISITDTGIGISAEFLPHVFDRFRQAQESSSSKGLGLGQAIARHLVELHGGTIHPASEGVG